MNAHYISQKEVNAYYQNTNTARQRKSAAHTDAGDILISAICAVAALVTSRAFTIILRSAVAVGLFFAVFGVIGGMEAGSIGLFKGVVLSLALSFIELAVLRSMVAGGKKPRSRS